MMMVEKKKRMKADAEVYDAAIVKARIQTKTLILCANQATCTISIQAVQWDTLQRRCADEVMIIWLD